MSLVFPGGTGPIPILRIEVSGGVAEGAAVAGIVPFEEQDAVLGLGEEPRNRRILCD